MHAISRLAAATALISAMDVLAAEPVACPGGRVFTEGAGDDAETICAHAARATEQLKSFDLSVPAPVTISVLPELEDHCLGVYHCGTGRIDILAPAAYEVLRERGEASAFATVSDDAFFESVIRHEMTHAALDSLPCPFEACPVGQEYIAYTMQVWFLPEVDRIAFEEAKPGDEPISRDMLSEVMLLMAPELFAHRAWLHLQDRKDPYAFIGQIARGEVLLDYERP
ncbi:hypothetical protein [Histidinibacterium aquaticum]|uniref:Uncharacterized protein n=1 Tax=Histidinibacterium aquaticum TaxID=2613962 RepID=A0A5J5GJA8_9RHOB|nr:hypothetical protein [Histidinibacterium aquaticum]KAA9008235.1 hypothetical protein F3S47_12155 [Histidinibacterium aquaticum]